MVTDRLTERMDSVHNLSIKWSVTIGTMLNLDGDGHGHGDVDVTCKRDGDGHGHGDGDVTCKRALTDITLSSVHT